MPYASNLSLPKAIRHSLPQGAQTIFRKAYNNASKQYRDPSKRRGRASFEEVCNKVAWAAVKKVYVKRDDKWVKI